MRNRGRIAPGAAREGASGRPDPGEVEAAPEADPRASALFHERVFAIVAAIPRGRVTTYGRIARAIGQPRAARMVGWALHASHSEPDLPCHRVINRNGELTGRWHWGDPDLMRALLEAEGIAFDERERVDLRRFGWEPDEVVGDSRPDGGRSVRAVPSDD